VNNSGLETSLNTFLATSQDKNYSIFLKSLNFDELEAYFYIEAQRSNKMIQYITSMNGMQLNIDDLKNTENIKYIPKGNRFTEGIRSLISFWDIFGKIPSPLYSIRQSVIQKYSDKYRELTVDESDFFLSC
jgi:hypothetical protein